MKLICSPRSYRGSTRFRVFSRCLNVLTLCLSLCTLFFAITVASAASADVEPMQVGVEYTVLTGQDVGIPMRWVADGVVVLGWTKVGTPSLGGMLEFEGQLSSEDYQRLFRLSNVFVEGAAIATVQAIRRMKASGWEFVSALPLNRSGRMGDHRTTFSAQTGAVLIFRASPPSSR
jgi:hypothetical protein